MNRRRLATAWAAGASAVLATVMAVAVSAPAQAATLLSDDFEDGNSSGWSTSGGTWSVVTDGSRVLRQGGTSADAVARAGSSAWTNYTVTARVKPIAYANSSRFVALLSRVRANTSYYYLALTGGGTLVLGKRVSGSLTPLAQTSFAVAPGTWYSLSLTASGSSLTGGVAGGPTLSATDSQYPSGQTGLATSYASGAIDDVLVSDSAGPTSTGTTTRPPTTTTRPPTTTTRPPTTTTRPPTTTTRPPTTPPTCGTVPAGLVGWAAATAGGGPTTGGSCGPTVTVTSLSQLQAEAEADGARTILVNGMLSGSGTVEITANKTIQGVGANSGTSGVTLNIEDMHPANVIIRNLNIRGVPGGDAIQVENADHIWVDHNTLSSDLDHDFDFYDGLLDITHAGDYITVSWNRFANHFKNSLVGHSDGNSGEDTGHLRITYHHNWFDSTKQRNPRLRFGDPVHVYNNYYLNVDGDPEHYAIASTMNAGVLVENNVFENVQQACWSASGYADSDPGRLVARGNVLTNSGPCEVNGTVAAIPYAYQLENVNTVKASVMAGSGAGRI
jgi:pectate lyase